MACSSRTSPLIAAHRGGMDSGHPENSLPTLRHAALAGAHVVELDLRATVDGAVVVLHDASVDRTTDGRGRIDTLALEEVRRLDAGGGVRVPTLREALAAAALLDVDLLLDLKPAPGLRLDQVARMVAEHHDPDRVLFGVRSLDARAELAAVSPALRYLGFVPAPDAVEAFLGAGVADIRLWPHWIDRVPGLVDRVHAGGGRVWVTTGAAPEAELRRLAALGADALLTDLPAAALAGFYCRAAGSGESR